VGVHPRNNVSSCCGDAEIECSWNIAGGIIDEQHSHIGPTLAEFVNNSTAAIF